MLEVLTQFGINVASLGKYVIPLAILYVLIKFKVIELVSVDQATELVRTRWKTARYYKFGKRKGRLIRLKPGRHLIIKGIHGGWPVPTAEIISTLLDEQLSIGGRAYMIHRVSIGFQVHTTDDPIGDEAVLRYLLSIQDANRGDQIPEGLLQKVQSIIMRWLPDATVNDPFGIPTAVESTLERLVHDELYAHGVELSSFHMISPSLAVSQAIADTRQYGEAVIPFVAGSEN